MSGLHRTAPPEVNRRLIPGMLAVLTAAVFILAGTLHSSPNAQAAADTTDPLRSAQEQLQVCQAALRATNPAPTSTMRTWANTCIAVQQAAIRVLTAATPSPSPTVTSVSPTPAPTSASPTPAPTTASPTPTPTTPSPTPTTASPSPTPTPTPTPTGAACTNPTSPPDTNFNILPGYPGCADTGVPPGQTLLPWSGCPAGGGTATMTTAGLHLDSVIINCDLEIHTSGVVITRSRINGSVNDGEVNTRSYSLDQVEVNAGICQCPAVWHTHLTVTRSNIHGGQTAVSCVEACNVSDSWLHGQVHDPSFPNQHFGGFLSNGGGSAAAPSLIRHNTVVCDITPQIVTQAGTASCSGAINLFGDFGGVSHYTFDQNLIQASGDMSYCIYGGGGKAGMPDNISFTNNMMLRVASLTPPRCAWWGNVSSWLPNQPGMVWSGNTFEDGTPLNP